jgi:peptidoglycan/LPS O-acetylase OafA/YrhL
MNPTGEKQERRFQLSRDADAVAAVLLGMVLSVGVACGLWFGVESRILRWKGHRVPRPVRPEISLQTQVL